MKAGHPEKPGGLLNIRKREAVPGSAVQAAEMPARTTGANTIASKRGAKFMRIKPGHFLPVVLTAALLAPLAASAQFLGHNVPDDPMPVTADAMGNIWSAKPTRMIQYKEPNQPVWRIKEILASHKGQTDWVQPIVRNNEQDADYISLGPGKVQKARFYSDDRVVFIVYSGQVKVS